MKSKKNYTDMKYKTRKNNNVIYNQFFFIIALIL